MIAPVAPIPSINILQDWRRQIGGSQRRTSPHPVRPFVIVSYVIRRNPRRWPLVDLNDITLVALFDEQLASGRLATRLTGICGCQTNQGLQFGGPEQCRFDKDLRLRPILGGRGASFDPGRGDLLAFALQLDRYLERVARYPFYPRRRVPLLPTLAPAGDHSRSALVDVSLVRKRQVITCADTTALWGTQGTTSFDFYHTRFHHG